MRYGSLEAAVSEVLLKCGWCYRSDLILYARMLCNGNGTYAAGLIRCMEREGLIRRSRVDKPPGARGSDTGGVRVGFDGRTLRVHTPFTFKRFYRDSSMKENYILMNYVRAALIKWQEENGMVLDLYSCFRITDDAEDFEMEFVVCPMKEFIKQPDAIIGSMGGSNNEIQL